MLRKAALLASLCAFAACNNDRAPGNGDPDTGPGGPAGAERTIQRIDVVGANDTESCLTGTGEEFDFLFSVVDVDDRLVAPGSNINDISLALNDTFTTGNVTFEDVVVFPSPDLVCATDADCGSLTGPYTCRSRNEAVRDAERVCGFDASIEMIQDSLRYLPEASAPREKSIVVSLANGSSILGLNEETGDARDRFSTDPDNRRIDAALEFLSGLEDLYPPEDSTACITWFTGDGSDSVNFIPDEDSCLRSLSDVAGADQQAALRQITLNGEGINAGKRANWAALDVAMDHIRSRTSSTFDRHVVLFTDGRDNGSTPGQRSQTPDALAEFAGLNGFRLHIVQLDNDHTGVEQGPIEDFEQLACQTGGTFLYSRHPEGVVRHFRNLRTAFANRYGLRLRIPELSQVPAGSYRVAASISMDLHGDVVGARLIGDNTDQLNVPTDTRLVVRTR